MNSMKNRRVLHAVLFLLLLFACLFPCTVNGAKDGGRYALTASAATAHAELSVEKYDVWMRIKEDRKIEVVERITVRFLDDDLTMFYRSLPTDGARYENIQATCAGNDEFYFYVADNEEGGPFIDINCVGNADLNKVWTYEISYLMEQGADTVKDGMTIDVIGFGWMIPLSNVSVQVQFPDKPTSTEIFTDVFGSSWGTGVTETWLNNTTLLLTADYLEVGYVDKYDEWVAGGITLQFTLPEGTLMGYQRTRLFTQDMWKILLGAGVAIVMAVLVAVLFGKKEELVTVVNISPPKGMDPMKMGKWIDGTVNHEDITSMIYHFANKGYLTIDFTDENDPCLMTAYNDLPTIATPYEKTLFNGLFNGAETRADRGSNRCVKVSELTGKFYEASRTAMQQVPDVPTMYEKKSIFAYLLGPTFGFLLGVILPLLVSRRIGGGYGYLLGIVFVIPLGANAFIGYMCENYRYKWKAGRRNLLRLAQLAIALLFSVVFVGWMAEHVLTGYEKAFLSIGVFLTAFITSNKLSRTEEYKQDLGDILGFKDFIVATEEDKIKVMLEKDPELYYDVLPYAQVLGVTDEWESKFKNLLVQPPSWYYSTGDLTFFDCYLISRCLNRSMMLSMARIATEAASKGAGSFVGRSGGGGSFGGFGGGGFGGGGGGAR